MLEWNVYVDDFNKREIVIHNIFNHYSFVEDLKKIIKKYTEKKEFSEQVRKILMYYYWSKCEWEIVLQGWPCRDDFKEEKIDVYDQIKLNWNRFIDYIWENKTEISKIKR